MNDQNMQTIKNATLDDVRPGDHVVWELFHEICGATITYRREGIAHHRDKWGDWCNEDDVCVTDGEDKFTTLTIRRPLTKEG